MVKPDYTQLPPSMRPPFGEVHPWLAVIVLAAMIVVPIVAALCLALEGLF